MNISTCMKILETNQANLGTSLKNVETQIGQLAQYLRENPPKSFPRVIEKNPKQCMVVTLRSGKELDEPKNIKKDEKRVEQKNLEVEEKMELRVIKKKLN